MMLSGTVGLVLAAPAAASGSLPPVCTSLAPSQGYNIGGDAVTVSGQNFTGTTAVTFGASGTASFTVISDTQVNVITPVAGASSANRNVTVTNAVGTSPATALCMFAYVAAPAGDVEIHNVSGYALTLVQAQINTLAMGLALVVGCTVVFGVAQVFRG
jgi:hypothetical protein